MAPKPLLDPGSWLQSLGLTRANGSRAFAWPRFLVPESRAFAWPMNWDELVLGGLPRTLWTNKNRWAKKTILNEVWIKPRCKPSDHLNLSAKTKKMMWRTLVFPNPPRHLMIFGAKVFGSEFLAPRYITWWILLSHSRVYPTKTPRDPVGQWGFAPQSLLYGALPIDPMKGFWGGGIKGRLWSHFLLSTPKSQRVLRCAIAMPIADPRDR